MKVTEHIERAKDTLFSFEILPPLKGQTINQIYEAIEPLMEFKPPFIDVTYHREEYVFRKQGNGLHKKQSIRKRPGTVAICAAIMYKYNVDAIPHLICGGFTKDQTEYALIDLNFLGIDNVLALRGDPVKNESSFMPEDEGHQDSCSLISQIKYMNDGVYLDDELQNVNQSDFCIGVAGYPEKHFESPNMMSDIRYLKKKVEAGADYVVTQMFFDNKKYFEFVNLCRENDIHIPIIPGIKPMTTKSQISALPRHFHIDIPEDLSQAIENCADNKAARQIGVEWGIQQCKELIAGGAPCIHFFTMSRINVQDFEGSFLKKFQPELSLVCSK